MRKRKKVSFPIYENIEIIDLAIEGKALGKLKSESPEEKDLIIFVEKVVPGDIVDVKINKSKKNYKEGYPLKFHKYSEQRVNAFCEHFGICGGCTRQQLSYETQLYYKQKQTEETLKRISKIPLPEIQKIIASPEIIYYRNKLEYTFTESRWLTQDEIDLDQEIKHFKGIGFHIPGRFDKIIDIHKCWLQPEPSNYIRLFIKEFAINNKFEFFNHYKNSGFLRTLIIRTSSTGEIMIIVSFFKNDLEKIHPLLDAVSKKFPEISSINYVVNEKQNDTVSDLEFIRYKGKDHIIEQMGEIIFKVSPKSFYQTNSKQAYNLYSIVKEFANLKKTDIVYDLYTGTGTIANFLANNVCKVIGVEYVEESIQDAIVNSEINGIKNTKFYSGDIKEVLSNSFFIENGKPDVLIFDPPRAGLHTKVIDKVLETEADRIVYVSCNIATQARDISLLFEKYDVIKIQPVDMFPHTHHIENVILLKKREKV
jgi:23S rRNA (uracil1939-C5)-methyltransferase